MKTNNAKNNSLVTILLTIACMFVSVSQASTYYTWPAYSPTVAYDYRDEFVATDPPTQLCPDGVYDRLTGGAPSTYIDRWWCFRWGSDANPQVTSDAWIPMLERFNDDFDYITSVMGWPRDRRGKEGYYSTVYLYGSGLSTDAASNTDPGGWMGSAGGYPMVLASYIPVCAFNPATPDGYQTGAMIHEGIHAIYADMPGCFSSCWFHEGGNTWLQATMTAQRSGSFTGLGWLSVGSVIAPFMPIECYSGWLQDGSFGGPCYINVHGGCTWRNLLGGVQYSEAFPHALEVILGPKSLAWVWNNAKYSGRVLQDLAEAPGGLGGAQVRRLIQEYRGRQAFCDFGLWSYAYRQLLHGGWGVTIQEEYEPFWIDVDPWYATCYVDTTQNGNTLTPDALTLPGWSGANQIPLTIDPGATEATVTFNPIGANMSCQLVYRNASGDVQYGVPVSSGTCSIPLGNVMNNVVIAVICNTDYIYIPDAQDQWTTSLKFDYTLTMGAGVTGTADIYTKWFAYNPSSYTITASAGANGSISPSGNVVVSAGGSRTFNFMPDSGYDVDEVTLNGYGIGPMYSYTLNDVRGDCTIGVTFKVIGVDEIPPTPNPATWASLPTSIGSGSVTMTATTGWDASGVVEYYFAEMSGNPGGSDSGWQSSPTYTDTGLSDFMLYEYRVRIRDAYDNKTVWSSSESVMTSAPAGGTTIGTTGSWGNNPATRRDAALDGDLNTYFDSNLATGGWVGLDLGESYVIKYIRYAPRVSWAWRMVGGEFQGSNTANFSSFVTLFTVSSAPPEGVLTARAITDLNGYRYVRYIGPTDGYCNVSEIEFYGDTYANTPPLNPTGLVATDGDTGVSLNWDDNADPDLMHYDIYRSTTSGSGYVLIYSGQTTSDYVDNSVTNGTPYYYVVTAVDTNSNESGYSNEGSAIPNGAPTFNTDPIIELDAIEDVAYSSTLADDASDPESEPLTFSKISGPDWLGVASDGTLSGTPSTTDVGLNTFTVQVSATGGVNTATMTIQVANIYDGTQGMEDLLGLASLWLMTGCTDTPSCDGADLDGDNNVTLSDFSIQAHKFLVPKDLQLWFKFDEMAGTVANDSSVYWRNGLLFNSPTWDTGNLGGALDFDGTNYVQVTDDAGLNPNTDSFSVAFWMKSDVASQGALIVSKRPNTTPYIQYLIGLSSGNIISFPAGKKLTFLFASETGERKGGYTLDDIVFNEWTHVCVVLDQDADTVYVYINGVPVQVNVSPNDTLSRINNTAPVYIGQIPSLSSKAYYGLVDDVRIYNVALSAQEVLSLSQ